MRVFTLSLCIIVAFGAKNEECPNELASEECVEDCVTANTECILECEDGNCIRKGSTFKAPSWSLQLKRATLEGAFKL